MPKKEDNLKEIDDLINSKREDLSHSYEYRNKLLESVKKRLGDLNISSIKMGNETLSLAEKNKNFSSFVKDENYFTSLLNEGSPLFILNVNTDTVSYSDIQSVLFKNQKIDDLIDKEMVMSLAPTSTIYAPKEKKPWSEIFQTDSYQIFLTDKNELIELWRNLKKWSKTHWHDDKMKNKKYFHKAENVFSITLIHDIKSDISWKFAQHKSKEIKFEEASALGEWDSLTQQELKKIINSLVQLENNPKISSQINQILEQVKPMLADSMEGKKVLKDFQKEVEKANKILYKSFTTVRLDWKQWHADFLSPNDLK